MIESILAYNQNIIKFLYAIVYTLESYFQSSLTHSRYFLDNRIQDGHQKQQECKIIKVNNFNKACIARLYRPPGSPKIQSRIFPEENFQIKFYLVFLVRR